MSNNTVLLFLCIFSARETNTLVVSSIMSTHAPMDKGRGVRRTEKEKGGKGGTCCLFCGAIVAAVDGRRHETAGGGARPPSPPLPPLHHKGARCPAVLRRVLLQPRHQVRRQHTQHLLYPLEAATLLEAVLDGDTLWGALCSHDGGVHPPSSTGHPTAGGLPKLAHHLIQHQRPQLLHALHGKFTLQGGVGFMADAGDGSHGQGRNKLCRVWGQE
mmetsp:Transcript_8277/g.14931  ORF Transcript_8277/g.14931 Transcript_8277/m.14931 type:complete len:215 (+) Transcript_8277:421-1065(+)